MTKIKNQAFLYVQNKLLLQKCEYCKMKMRVAVYLCMHMQTPAMLEQPPAQIMSTLSSKAYTTPQTEGKGKV